MGSLFDEEEGHIVVTTKNKKIKLKLINFVSLATPMIGVRGLQSSFLYYGTKIAYWLGTGPQLVLGKKNYLIKDDDIKEPLLYKLSHEKYNYFKALNSCKIRITISTALNDEKIVPYQSSAMVTWKKLKIKEKINENEKILELSYDKADEIPKQSKEEEEEENIFDGCEKKDIIMSMINSLRKMDWIRLDAELYHKEITKLIGHDEILKELFKKMIL
jgi:hypothetical protein